MATLFSRIISGDLPGRFVWKDDRAVVFLTIAPLRPGHCLVVPRDEVDHWLDLAPDLAAHLMEVSRKVGRSVHAAFPSTKVALMIAGLEVPHVHVHLVPIDGLQDMEFARQDLHAKPADLDAAAERIRAALRAAGHPEVATA